MLRLYRFEAYDNWIFMIVVFSSNENGGLIQMAIKVTEELYKLGTEVRCFIPTIAKCSIPKEIHTLIVRYKKTKSPFPYNSVVKKVSAQLLSLEPDLIWYVDNGTFTSQVGINLAGRVKQALVMHDAGVSHSSFNTSLRQRIKCFIEKKTSEICNKQIDWIVTCSPNSKNVYSKLYPSLKDKVYMLPLGPHMPEMKAICPTEIKDLSDYFMFFGRIDKYKGIDVLLHSFTKWKGNRKLVIAGGGKLQPEEIKMANEDHRVILINRFIKDEEMPYLFNNARAIVLPYKDATQSGILPIAYMCGKPVICSKVMGISQFVENNITGFICADIDDYVAAYSKVEDNDILEGMSNNARLYYETQLDWAENIKKMLKQFHVK